MSMDARARSATLRRLADEQFDLLIIGGGINGAGVARDASSRGLKVALVEADDFASGTSSRSSKLIHGGIRYLENYEFGLVFEALSERQILFKMAPHLVHPLRFLIPLYRGGRVGMGLMGLGMWVYDALSLFQAPELHERLSPREAIDEVPSLRSQDLMGAYLYSDAYMDDDRLVFETLRSAAQNGAVSCSFVRAEESRIDQGNIQGVHCQDQLSNQTFFIKAKHVVTTVGAWTDRVAPHLVPNWSRWLRPSKGVHLTFRRDRLPLPHAVVMAAEERIVFAIPRHEMVIVGTTDTDFSLNPADVTTERRDVDYILSVIHRYFPGAGVVEADILSSYSGVRPLVDDQSESEGKTSREHRIQSDPCGVTFVAGGKYTTYRRIAEEVVDEVLDFIGSESLVCLRPSDTRRPLNSLITEESWAQRAAVCAELKQELGAGPEVSQLVERHGDEAPEICRRNLAHVRTVLGAEAAGAALVWGLEAAHAIASTQCLTLRDFVLRRSPLFLSRADHGEPLYNAIAKVMMSYLGERQFKPDEQMGLLQKHISAELGWAR